jgi:hypothetical protein
MFIEFCGLTRKARGAHPRYSLVAAVIRNLVIASTALAGFVLASFTMPDGTAATAARRAITIVAPYLLAIVPKSCEVNRFQRR